MFQIISHVCRSVLVGNKNLVSTLRISKNNNELNKDMRKSIDLLVQKFGNQVLH